MRRGTARQWWLRGCANRLGRPGLDELLTPDPRGALPSDSSAGFCHPPGLRRPQTLHRPGGCSLHHLLPPSQGAQPHPRVAAQSPPPTRPREQASGTEFNRHHQQPPGRLGKVDTLIPVTVSGERARPLPAPPLLPGEGGRGPTPHWASPSLADAMVMSPMENIP